MKTNMANVCLYNQLRADGATAPDIQGKGGSKE